MRISAWLLGACLLGAVAVGADDVPPRTFLLDGEVIAANRQRVLSGDPALMPAYSNLLHQAELDLGSGPFSVTDKTLTPPSGDKHDYMSFGRYWWPDPSRPDGRPYIRRDGETNPASQGTGSDRPRLGAVTGAVQTLALAYYFSGKERFADRAALLIRTWFLDPETRMRPHLRYAQGIPGIADGRSTGVLDGRLLGKVIDGLALLRGSPALTASERAELQAWFRAYLGWLKTDPNAIEESNAQNNHGTHFDAQVVHVALYVGDIEFARSVLEAAVQKRLLAQIRPDGSQPEELARTRSLHYSLFNLEAFFALARLGECVGVDLWHAEDSRLRAAMDFVAPYADPARQWPYPAIDKIERVRFYPLLVQAAAAYGSDRYRDLAGQVPAPETIVLRDNLLLAPPQ